MDSYDSQAMKIFESKAEYEEHLSLAKHDTQEVVREAREYLVPLGIAPEFFAQAAVTALSTNSHLLKADRKSFGLALLKCAQCGLIPDGESAALVPFKNKVTLIKMYGGMLDIIRRNIPGIGVECSVVWEWDEFDIAKGDDARIVHVPKPLPSHLDGKAYRDWHRIRAAYCIITLPSFSPGSYPVKERQCMYRSEIEPIRNASRGSHVPGSAWKEWPAKMCEKTVLRQACRRLPSRSQIFATINSLELDDYTGETESELERAARVRQGGKAVEPADVRAVGLGAPPPKRLV